MGREGIGTGGLAGIWIWGLEPICARSKAQPKSNPRPFNKRKGLAPKHGNQKNNSRETINPAKKAMQLLLFSKSWGEKPGHPPKLSNLSKVVGSHSNRQNGVKRAQQYMASPRPGSESQGRGLTQIRKKKGNKVHTLNVKSLK